MRLPALPHITAPLPKVRFKATAPKIAAVHIHPVSNGFKVTHQFQAPHKPKQFVFQNPAKMVQHLRRIENTAWLHPNTARDAKREVEVLDLGETP